jgi:hypothetical protein
LFKFISNVLLGALAIALTIFTASRTLDLLGQWLPAGQDIYKWLALAAFEGGFYFWALYLSTSAKGAAQRGIALMALFVSFVGIAVATIMDLVMTGAKEGKLPDIPMESRQALVIMIGIVIVLHVAAFMAAKLTGPDKLKEWAYQDAEDYIESENLAMVRRATPRLAAQAAPLMTEKWVGETWNKMLPNAARPLGVVESSQQYYLNGPAPVELPPASRMSRHNADQFPVMAPAQLAQVASAPAPRREAPEKRSLIDSAKGLLGLGEKEKATPAPAPARTVVKIEEEPQPAPAPEPQKEEKPTPQPEPQKEEKPTPQPEPEAQPQKQEEKKPARGFIQVPAKVENGAKDRANRRRLRRRNKRSGGGARKGGEPKA